ncbi:MAG: DUF975 domain-containing protein [Snowella sp.]|nr:DUF975 domain-containing protein [Snowella sp.]
MSREIHRRPSNETLSVGNVVSAGLRIYRDNFKVYYLEALKSYLWVLVPVYGWAKFAAIQALIARLAFCEVRETPESLADARRQVMPKMWIFLVTGILIGSIFFAGLFVFVIISILVGTGFNALVSVVFSLLMLLYALFLIFAYIWLISRIAFAELAIAIDDIREATKAIGRSWTITQGFVGKIQIIFFIAFLLTIPFSAVSNLGSLLFQSAEWGAVINLLLTIPLGALLVPFWQSIKAVIYYDLLTRKEGLGLELRDLNDNF